MRSHMSLPKLFLAAIIGFLLSFILLFGLFFTPLFGELMGEQRLDPYEQMARFGEATNALGSFWWWSAVGIVGCGATMGIVRWWSGD